MTEIRKGDYVRILRPTHVLDSVPWHGYWTTGDITRVRAVKPGEVGLRSFDHTRWNAANTAFVPASDVEAIPTPIAIRLFRIVRLIALAGTVASFLPRKGVFAAMQLLQQFMQDPLVFGATTHAYAMAAMAAGGGVVILVIRQAIRSIHGGLEARRLTSRQRMIADRDERWAEEDRLRDRETWESQRRIEGVTALVDRLQASPPPAITGPWHASPGPPPAIIGPPRPGDTVRFIQSPRTGIIDARHRGKQLDIGHEVVVGGIVMSNSYHDIVSGTSFHEDDVVIVHRPKFPEADSCTTS